MLGDVFHAVFFAELFQPIGAAAARCHDGILRKDIHALTAVRFGDGNALAYPVFNEQRIAFVIEKNFHAVILQIFFNGEIDALRLFRAHVADGTIDKLQPRLNGALADFLNLFADVEAFDVLVRAEFEINFIRIIDRILRQRLADQHGQVPAHFTA